MKLFTTGGRKRKRKKQQNVKRYDMQYSFTEKEKFKIKFTAWLQQLLSKQTN